jgi:peptide/nickel transport system ATP-binding protein
MSTASGSDGAAIEDPLAGPVSERAAQNGASNGLAGGPVLEVDDLTVGFPGDDGLVQAVRGVSYELRPGEVLGIVGESGSGKSVTSLAVMGLLPRTAKVSGSVRFRGQELIGASDAALNKVRGRSVSMIFQDPMTSLNPVYTIGFQVAEAVLAHQDVGKTKARERALELLEAVRIPNPRQRLDNFPHELSGGMRQRVVIAIAMANNPDVIIADEPTTALDVTVQAQIMDALRLAQEQTGAAMVLITHDLGVIAGQADRVAVMYAGKLVEIGTAEDIFYTARMPYTFGLLGSLPRMDRPSERLTPITGAPPSVVNMPPGCPFSPRCPLAVQICEDVEPELEPTTGPEHLAACHRSDELIGRSPGDVFETAVADTAALANLIEADAGTRGQS